MRLFGHTDRAERPALPAEATPQAADVAIEIGLVLAVHLAIALAVILTLGACGVA
jgi:hypothetical protein